RYVARRACAERTPGRAPDLEVREFPDAWRGGPVVLRRGLVRERGRPRVVQLERNRTGFARPGLQVELLHARCGHRRAATAGAEPGTIDAAPVRTDDDQPIGRPRTDHAGDDVADRIGALLQPRRVRPGYA